MNKVLGLLVFIFAIGSAANYYSLHHGDKDAAALQIKLKDQTAKLDAATKDFETAKAHQTDAIVNLSATNKKLADLEAQIKEKDKLYSAQADKLNQITMENEELAYNATVPADNKKNSFGSIRRPGTGIAPLAPPPPPSKPAKGKK